MMDENGYKEFLWNNTAPCWKCDSKMYLYQDDEEIVLYCSKCGNGVRDTDFLDWIKMIEWWNYRRVQPISEGYYKYALKRIEHLMDAEPNSPDEEELDRLADLVEKYEDTYFPIEKPSKLGLIKFRISQEGGFFKFCVSQYGLIGYLTKIIKRRMNDE